MKVENRLIYEAYTEPLKEVVMVSVIFWKSYKVMVVASGISKITGSKFTSGGRVTIPVTYKSVECNPQFKSYYQLPDRPAVGKRAFDYLFHNKTFPSIGPKEWIKDCTSFANLFGKAVDVDPSNTIFTVNSILQPYLEAPAQWYGEMPDRSLKQMSYIEYNLCGVVDVEQHKAAQELATSVGDEDLLGIKDLFKNL